MMELLSCRYNMDTAIQLFNVKQLQRWIAYRKYTIYILH